MQVAIAVNIIDEVSHDTNDQNPNVMVTATAVPYVPLREEMVNDRLLATVTMLEAIVFTVLGFFFVYSYVMAIVGICHHELNQDEILGNILVYTHVYITKMVISMCGYRECDQHNTMTSDQQHRIDVDFCTKFIIGVSLHVCAACYFTHQMPYHVFKWVLFFWHPFSMLCMKTVLCCLFK